MCNHCAIVVIENNSHFNGSTVQATITQINQYLRPLNENNLPLYYFNVQVRE